MASRETMGTPIFGRQHQVAVGLAQDAVGIEPVDIAGYLAAIRVDVDAPPFVVWGEGDQLGGEPGFNRLG